MRGGEEVSPQDTSWDWNETCLSSHLKCRAPLSGLSDVPPVPVSYWGKWEQQPPPAGWPRGIKFTRRHWGSTGYWLMGPKA